jgi:hypothetical protein
MWAFVEENSGLAWLLLTVAAMLFELGIEGCITLTNRVTWPTGD